MDESDALALLSEEIGVGDDCASVTAPEEANLLLTTDMLHETTDFPDGVTPYTVGWRSAAVSLSDVAGSGGRALAVVAAYGAPTFEGLNGFVRGAREACETVGAEYVGGDLDAHDERTVVSSAVGAAEEAVRRSGASVGDAVAVTGDLGRTAVGLRAFEDGDDAPGNDLFRFTPRVSEGVSLSPYATSMTDLSDGVVVGAHSIAERSGVGVSLVGDALPLDDGARDDDIFVGEDYELLLTLPESAVGEARASLDGSGVSTGLTVVGECTEGEGMVKLDGERVGRRGYEH